MEGLAIVEGSPRPSAGGYCRCCPFISSADKATEAAEELVVIADSSW